MNRPQPGWGQRLLSGIGILLLLAGIILTVWLDSSIPGLDDYALHSEAGLVILFTDQQSPRLANRLLAAGLAEHEIGLAVLSGRGLNTDSDSAAQRQNLSSTVNNLLRETGLGGHQVLYAGMSPVAGDLLRLIAAAESDLPQPRGLLLLAPDNTASEPGAFASLLPAELATAIFAPVEPAQAESATDLFFWLSGEDASLFPGLSSNRPAASQTWLSLNGRHRLVLTPAVSGVAAAWSPRLRAGMAQAAAEMLAADPEAQLRVSNSLAASSSLIYNSTLLALLALLLLAAAPLVLIIARQTGLNRTLTADSQSVSSTAADSKADFASSVASKTQAAGPPTVISASADPSVLPWVSLLLYLPAAALALPLGNSLARAMGNIQLSANLRFYALIGIYGWLYTFVYLLTTRVAGRSGYNTARYADRKAARYADRNDDRSDSRRNDLSLGLRLSSSRSTVLSSWLAVLLLGAFIYWLYVMTGRVVQPTTLKLFLLTELPLVLVLAPAMLPYLQPYLQLPGVTRAPDSRFLAALTAILRGLPPVLFLFGLRLLENPTAPLAALAAAAAAALILFSARTVVRAVYIPGSRIVVPLAAGLLLILLLRPYLLF